MDPSPTLSIPHQWSARYRIDADHQKPRVHSSHEGSLWCYLPYGFGQMSADMCLPL